MVKPPQLFKQASSQWKLYGNAFSNIAQAIVIFSLAAIFVPEAVSLSRNFSQVFGVTCFIAGLILLYVAGILIKKGS